MQIVFSVESQHGDFYNQAYYNVLFCVPPGVPNEVCCFFCGGRLSRWQQNDDPMAKHRQLCPTCGFVRLMAEAHIERTTDSESSQQERTRLALYPFQTTRYTCFTLALVLYVVGSTWWWSLLILLKVVLYFLYCVV